MTDITSLHYMHGTSQYWRECDSIRKFLKKIVPKQDSQSRIVGVAGEAALHWFQDWKQSGPKWSQPGEVKVFVCMRKRFFIGFMETIFARMNNLSIKHAKNQSSTKMHYRDEDLIIVDVHLDGMTTTIRFIESPEPSMPYVIKRFDVSVCRVYYDIHAERFGIVASVLSDVDLGTAVVSGHTFGSNGPDLFDRRNIQQKLLRIKKYQLRGFVFGNVGSMFFMPVPQAAMA